MQVRHVRREAVDLDKARDVESAIGKGVLYVGHSKNETSKRRISLNGAARDAITRMLKRADELGQTTLSITSGARINTRPYGKTDLGFASHAGYADRESAQRRAAYKGGRS